jgi:hypothetical protein
LRAHALLSTARMHDPTAMGQDLSVEEIFDIAALADPDSSGEIGASSSHRVPARVPGSS